MADNNIKKDESKELVLDNSNEVENIEIVEDTLTEEDIENNLILDGDIGNPDMLQLQNSSELENEDEKCHKEETIKLTESIYNNISSWFKKKKNKDESDIFVKNKIRIKDGIIYSSSVSNIIESGIKLSKGNLLILIPELVNLEHDDITDFNPQYLLHNGDWWVNIKHSQLNSNDVVSVQS